MPAVRVLRSVALSSVLAACGSGASRHAATGGQTVMVEIRPARVSVLPGDVVDFTAAVTGTADPSVTWEVVESGGGTVSTTGTYVAPLVTGEYTVRAASQVTPNALSTAKVHVGHVAVAISPTTVTVGAGGSVWFTAKVTGTSNDAVTWSIREPSCGSISPSGLYTAPSSAASCHVDATSVADPSTVAEASASVTAPPTPPPPPPQPVVVTITPANAAVDACRTMAFAASVSGAADGAVNWTVQEGSVGGSITSAGVYSAPAAAGTYHVVATSQAASSSAVAAVTVADRIVGVAVSPETVTLGPGASVQLTATVTTTCGSFTSTKIVTAPN